MANKIIYHGSDHKIEKPIYQYEGASEENDYGPGFYCTEVEEAGKEWACKKEKHGVLNIYEIDDSDLRILRLTDKERYTVLHWLALLMENRELEPEFIENNKVALQWLSKKLINILEYDIVVGFRADDAYFKFPQAFVENRITLGRMNEIYELGDLGTQYVIISKKAYSKLKFIKSIEVNEEYFYKYQDRVDSAKEEYFKILSEERYASGTRIDDLIRMGQNK